MQLTWKTKVSYGCSRLSSLRATPCREYIGHTLSMMAHTPTTAVKPVPRPVIDDWKLCLRRWKGLEKTSRIGASALLTIGRAVCSKNLRGRAVTRLLTANEQALLEFACR